MDLLSLLAHRVNVCNLCGNGLCTSPCSVFHITEPWGWICSLIDFNFVMWVLVTWGVDFIRNLQEKSSSQPAEGLKLSIAITLALKQIPSTSNTAFPFPVWIPSFLHPPILFSLSMLIWWYHRLFLRNLPEGTFLLRKEFYFCPSFALYREEWCCLHKQTALTWHEVHMNEMRLITVLVLGGKIGHWV